MCLLWVVRESYRLYTYTRSGKTYGVQYLLSTHTLYMQLALKPSMDWYFGQAKCSCEKSFNEEPSNKVTIWFVRIHTSGRFTAWGFLYADWNRGPWHGFDWFHVAIDATRLHTRYLLFFNTTTWCEHSFWLYICRQWGKIALRQIKIHTAMMHWWSVSI